MNEDFKQLVMICIVGIIAASAAYQGEWEIVGTIITGFFALMNVARKVSKGDKG